MAIGPKKRFSILSRDNFSCRYCGRKPPEVVLEVDHLIAVSGGGTDDEENLVSACQDCNRGKGISAADCPPGPSGIGDPSPEASENLRKLNEYNTALRSALAKRSNEAMIILAAWKELTGKEATTQELTWAKNALVYCPREVIEYYMVIAAERGKTNSLAYVIACVRNWKEESDQRNNVAE